MKKKVISKTDREKIVDEASQRFAELFVMQIDQKHLSDSKNIESKNRVVFDKDGNAVTL